MYYILRHSQDPKVVGNEYPQVTAMTKGYNYKSKASVHALSRHIDCLPDFKPELNSFILGRKAIVTDLISVSVAYGGVLVSEKFKNILEAVSLPVHKFFPATVVYKGGTLKYFWLHLISNFTDFVDYQASKFFVYQNFAHNLGYISISSKDDLNEKEKNLKYRNPGKTLVIWAEKIVLQSTFPSYLDLFKVGSFDNSLYISGLLRKAIETSKLTGLHIQAAENLSIAEN